MRTAAQSTVRRKWVATSLPPISTTGGQQKASSSSRQTTSAWRTSTTNYSDVFCVLPVTNYCHVQKRKFSGVIMSFMLYSLSNVVMSGTLFFLQGVCACAPVRACWCCGCSLGCYTTNYMSCLECNLRLYLATMCWCAAVAWGMTFSYCFKNHTWRGK